MYFAIWVKFVHFRYVTHMPVLYMEVVYNMSATQINISSPQTALFPTGQPLLDPVKPCTTCV